MYRWTDRSTAREDDDDDVAMEVDTEGDGAWIQRKGCSRKVRKENDNNNNAAIQKESNWTDGEIHKHSHKTPYKDNIIQSKTQTESDDEGKPIEAASISDNSKEHWWQTGFIHNQTQWNRNRIFFFLLRGK